MLFIPAPAASAFANNGPTLRLAVAVAASATGCSCNLRIRGVQPIAGHLLTRPGRVAGVRCDASNLSNGRTAASSKDLGEVTVSSTRPKDPIVTSVDTKQTAGYTRGSTLVLVGLGNPGPRFDDTRHNIGFTLVSAYASMHKGPPFKLDARLQAAVSTITVSDMTVHMLKPTTFMNSSGLTIRAALKKWAVPRCALLVVMDDVSLDLGRLRLRARGSAGGHNGLKSIQAAIGTPDYPRLKVGVGSPRDSEYLPDYVLSKFSRADRKLLQSVQLDVFDTLDYWVGEPDITRVMNKLGMLQSGSSKR